jgi:hypothetical protein
MNLQENINRIKSVMGLIIESTEKIQKNDGTIVLIADYVKDHIKSHNQFGSGSTFKEGITDEEINNFVNMVLEDNELGEGGPFELEIPGVGYDLVKPYQEALNYEDADETTTVKKERGVDIEVPLIKTSESSDNFKTDTLTLIIRKSNPDYLPEDVKEDTEILQGIKNGKVYSLLTAFPGNPNIPPTSQWNGEYAVIVPRKEDEENQMTDFNN